MHSAQNAIEAYVNSVTDNNDRPFNKWIEAYWNAIYASEASRQDRASRVAALPLIRSQPTPRHLSFWVENDYAASSALTATPLMPSNAPSVQPRSSTIGHPLNQLCRAGLTPSELARAARVYASRSCSTNPAMVANASASSEATVT